MIVTPPPVVEVQPVEVAPPPVVVAPPVEPTVVVIHSESDFYAPLSPYGQWVSVPGYGQCWRPAQVASTWRPYVNGHWDRTDAGWYWNSDEPWAWATYHYGRWDFSAQFGWVWIPKTQWAPAWVSWREGAGYVGWAPLPPTAHFNANVLDAHAPAPAARHFVFVPEHRMTEPVQAQTVIVNNTTVINQTVNITNVRVENKTVINEGPRVQEIERRTGRQLPAARVNDLRRRDESAVVARQHNAPPPREVRPPETPRPATPVNPPPHEVRQPEPPRNLVIPQGPGRQYDNRPPVVQNPPVQPTPEPRRPEPLTPPRQVMPRPVPPMTPAPNPVVTRPVPVRPGPQPAPVVTPQPPVTRPVAPRVEPRVEPQSPVTRPTPPTIIAPPAHAVPARVESEKPGRGEPPTVVQRPEVRPEPVPQTTRAATLRKAAQQQVRNQPHTPAKKPVVVQLHGTNVVVTPDVTNAPEFNPSIRGSRRR